MKLVIFDVVMENMFVLFYQQIYFVCIWLWYLYEIHCLDCGNGSSMLNIMIISKIHIFQDVSALKVNINYVILWLNIGGVDFEHFKHVWVLNNEHNYKTIKHWLDNDNEQSINVQYSLLKLRLWLNQNMLVRSHDNSHIYIYNLWLPHHHNHQYSAHQNLRY